MIPATKRYPGNVGEKHNAAVSDVAVADEPKEEADQHRRCRRFDGHAFDRKRRAGEIGELQCPEVGLPWIEPSRQSEKSPRCSPARIRRDNAG